MTRLRIAFGGFLHETNTFIQRPTTWEDFAVAGPWPGASVGEELFERFKGLNIAISGFAAEAARQGHELVPLAWAGAMPAGKVTTEAFEHMAGLLVDGIARAKPDLVFVEQHGAMVSEAHDDAEGEIVRRVRDIVGPDVPITGTLDLHGNISRAFVDATNLYSSFRTYPHVDWGESGARVARWIDRVMKRGAGRGRVFRQASFLIPVTTGCTLTEPARRLYRRVGEIEAETGVALSLNMGFPPADIADVGPSVIAYGATQADADRAADQLIAEVEAAEAEFAAHEPLPAAEAVAEATRISRKPTKGPVILADTQDNPGAGTPSNTTGLVLELLRQRVADALVGNFHDPKAAAAAHEVGIDGTIAGIGGGAEGPGQEPAPGPWRVAALSDGRFEGTGPMLRSKNATMGPTAILEQDGVRVLVNTLRQQPVHREVFSHLGHDPAEAKVLVLKSSAHFRSGFQDIAERVIVALSPGANPEDPSAFAYTKLRPGVRLRPRFAK